MALSHRQKRRWSLVILLIGLPLYIIAALALVSLLGRPPVWMELLIYAVLGILWALPFRHVFVGVGQAPPEGDGEG